MSKFYYLVEHFILYLVKRLARAARPRNMSRRPKDTLLEALLYLPLVAMVRRR
jgi:hypothetical protein